MKQVSQSALHSEMQTVKNSVVALCHELPWGLSHIPESHNSRNVRQSSKKANYIRSSSWPVHMVRPATSDPGVGENLERMA